MAASRYKRYQIDVARHPHDTEASYKESICPLVHGRETNMSKKLKLAFLAAVLAMISISSPVLAGYDDSGHTGAGSSGYNMGNGIH
jgi:hypothetical protein